MLQSERTLQIQTAYGPSSAFSPERGLPQGDIISPILWNIFYDPLLVRIDETPGYQFTDNLTISKLAYADDLETFTDNPEILQTQADTVVSYLTIFNMQVNGSKSILWTNQAKENSEYVQSIVPHINDQPITKIHFKDDLTRTLGVFFTADGQNKSTITHATTQINNLLKVINFKFTPGFLSVYLINTVLNPILVYRLQATPVTQTELKSINTSYRKLVRNKYNFSYASNLVLYDKELGINLQNIQSILDERLITNALLHERDQTILGKIHREMDRTVQNKLTLPERLMTCPVKFEKKPNPLILYVSNTLFFHDLQFRTISFNQETSILAKLTPDSYNEYFTTIKRLNLKSVDDITFHPNSIKPRFSRKVNNDSKPRLLTFEEFYRKLAPGTKKLKLFNDYLNLSQTPRFYQCLICLYAPYNELLSNRSLLDPNFKFNIREKLSTLVSTQRDIST